MIANNDLIEILKNSSLYKDYERAFTDTTGLPFALRPVETWQLPFHGKRRENSFCSIMSSTSRSCANCLQMQERLCQSAKSQPVALTCPNGLVEAAVPVQLGTETIGFLQTGQLFREKPTMAQFARMAKRLHEQGLELNQEHVRRAYFHTPLVLPVKLDSLIQLLGIFAAHLSLKSNQISVKVANAEPPAIARAKRFIQENHAREISLGDTAAAVHMSPYYFCKIFRKVTGMNFTEFVARTRITKATNLLLNPNLRVSEIAYEVGFQSLTHFNRTFKQIMHQSPSEYRSHLPAPPTSSGVGAISAVHEES